MTESPDTNAAIGSETVLVDRYVDGILDPARPMLGPLRDGGHIIANTTPGCWGPMITPCLRGGHEVTGAIEIGRHPGVVQVTFRAPVDRLERRGLLSFTSEQYGPPC